jgi:hypothetical protein
MPIRVSESTKIVSSFLIIEKELSLRYIFALHSPSGLTLSHVSRGGPLDDGVGIGGADEWCGVVVGLPQEAIDGGLAHGNL